MSRWTVLNVLLGVIGVGFGGAWAMLHEHPADVPPPVAAAPMIHADGQSPPQTSVEQIPHRTLKPSGYSGTWEERSTGRSTPRPRSTARLPTWNVRATPEQLQAVADELSGAASYAVALRRLWQLSGEITHEQRQEVVADKAVPYEVALTRFQREPDQMAKVMFDAFAKSSGIARQTLIFHIALAFPEATAFPWLRGLVESGEVEDAADALCALAFRGDEPALQRFERLPQSAENCRRIVDTAEEHDVLAIAGERGFLRSYRCIEAMDCRPYFLRHPWAFGRRDVGFWDVASFPWADRLRDDRKPLMTDLIPRLLRAWIAHYEGHPGTDDMAWRLCRHHRDRTEWIEAAVWASRCATFPDQDMSDYGVRELISIAEGHLSDGEIDDALLGGDYERNRQLLHYIRLRRTAAQRGFEKALADAAVVAAVEPDGFLAKCFRARWAAVVPAGLDSGVAALPPDDPLRVNERGVDAEPPAWSTTQDWQDARYRKLRHPGHEENLRRLNPLLEAVRLSGMLVARQFRAWETISELERRRDQHLGHDRADLEYKIGAVYFHDRNVLYPCYTVHNYQNALPRGVERPWSWKDQPSEQQVANHLALRKEFVSMARAANIFVRLAEEHFTWPGRDKALFSAGLARIKLVDYRPFTGLSNLDIVAGVRCFEQLATQHPASPLADDAANAARYWRKNFKGVFQADALVSAAD